MDMGSIDGGFTAGQEEIARGKGFVKLIHDLLIYFFSTEVTEGEYAGCLVTGRARGTPFEIC
jgi:hypothetical protein